MKRWQKWQWQRVRQLNECACETMATKRGVLSRVTFASVPVEYKVCNWTLLCYTVCSAIIAHNVLSGLWDIDDQVVQQTWNIQAKQWLKKKVHYAGSHLPLCPSNTKYTIEHCSAMCLSYLGSETKMVTTESPMIQSCTECRCKTKAC